jgi:hypothetical protein
MKIPRLKSSRAISRVNDEILTWLIAREDFGTRCKIVFPF